VIELRTFLSRYVAMSDEELASLASYVVPVSYEAGHDIAAEGVVCRDVVMVMSGFVRAFYIHDDKEVNLRLLRGPAAAVALASLITNEPARETVQAISSVRGFRARISDFEDHHPGPFVDRMRRVLAEQHYLSMDRRLRTLQHKTVAERYAYFRAQMEPEIVRGVAGFHIASYLGVTPESLSRERRKLARS
jgi:CRP-like cAMP-binding protein